MKTSKVISREAQEHFWQVVRACLQEFHQASPAVVARESKLRQTIENAPIEEAELFFHGEPFQVACGLAGQRLLIEPHLKRYLEILDGKDISDQ